MAGLNGTFLTTSIVNSVLLESEGRVSRNMKGVSSCEEESEGGKAATTLAVSTLGNSRGTVAALTTEGSSSLGGFKTVVERKKCRGVVEMCFHARTVS